MWEMESPKPVPGGPAPRLAVKNGSKMRSMTWGLIPGRCRHGKLNCAVVAAQVERTAPSEPLRDCRALEGEIEQDLFHFAFAGEDVEGVLVGEAKGDVAGFVSPRPCTRLTTLAATSLREMTLRLSSPGGRG